MSEIKQIQCPTCGANSTFKKVDGTYLCNYCQSTFELKDDDSTNQKKKEGSNQKSKVMDSGETQQGSHARSEHENDGGPTVREECIPEILLLHLERQRPRLGTQ